MKAQSDESVDGDYKAYVGGNQKMQSIMEKVRCIECEKSRN